jgi:hypothetical protein
MTWDTYKGYPVMTSAPNWAEPLKQSFITDVEVLQFLGIGRAWSQQAETALAWEAEFLLKDRTEIYWLKYYFDYLKGRWGAFWAPTWQADVKVISEIPAGLNYLYIQDMKYGDYWGSAGHEVTGRYLQIKYPNGAVEYRRVTGWPSSIRLNLDAALGQSVAEDALSGLLVSFLLFARFDQDELVLEYLTESVAKAKLRFRAIPAEAALFD